MKELLIDFVRGHDKVEFALIAGLLLLTFIGSEQNIGARISLEYQAIGATMNNPSH